MRQYLGIQSDRNTFHALRQQQRELNRQVNRFVLTAVIRLHPLGSLGIKNGLQRKLGQPCLDITRSCRAITRQYISPVSLAINEQILLAELNKGITDRSITVRVILHSLTNDVRHLVVLAVIHRLHGVQDTALYRLQTILDSRHSTLEYHIRSIVQEPVLVHARKMILHSIIETTLGRHR